MRPAWALPVSLFLLSLLAFANTFSHPFVHDDRVFIVQNPDIGRWDNLAGAFSGPSIAPVSGVNAYYRPLLEFIYRLEYSLFGLDPRGWHAANAIVHGINGVLVFQLLSLLGFGASFAWAVAAIFVVHPVQSETVACVAGLSNLWMGLFVLSAVIFYIKDKWAYSLLCFWFALLAKEQALAALPLVVLVDWYRGRKRAGLWLIFLAWALGFLAVRQVLTGSHLLHDILASPGELKLRLWAIAQVLASDVRILFVPYDLHYYRSTDILTAHGRWWLAVILAGAAVVWAVRAKNNRAVGFGALWFLFALGPVLNIVPLINEYSLILTAEHFLYLPMIGIIIIVGSILKSVIASEAAGRAKQSLFLVILILALSTIYQNTFWRSETALFERTVQFEPNFGRGQLLLAKAYYFDKRYNDANAHFAKAYEIMSGYARKAVGDGPQRFYHGFMKGILFDWAHSLENAGQAQEAMVKYQQALELDPADPVLWNNLGALCLKMGNVPQAKASFQKALAIAPDFLPARQNLRQLQ